MPSAGLPRCEKGPLFDKKVSYGWTRGGGCVDASRKPFVRRAILGIALMVAVYAGLAIFSDTKKLANVLTHFRWWAFGLAIVVAGAAYALRSMRWFVYLRRLGVWRTLGPKRLTLREALGMSLATGKAGQVVKSYYLAEGAGVPYSVSIPAGLAERMSDVVAIVILLLIGLAVGPKFSVIAALGAAALLIITLLLMRWEGTGHLLVRLVRRFKRLHKFAEHVEQAHAHLRPMLSARVLAVPVLLGLGAFALEATAMLILGKYGLRLNLDWGETAFILAAVDVAGTISLIPGGLGIIDGGMVFLLHVAADVPLASATALALLTRVCTLWLAGLLDGVAFAMLRGLTPERPKI